MTPVPQCSASPGTSGSVSTTPVVTTRWRADHLVPSAADDRLTHAPGARLVLAVPADDAPGITSDLAALMRQGAQVVTVPDDWRNLSTVADP
mgnify:CR=1 FL=1